MRFLFLATMLLAVSAQAQDVPNLTSETFSGTAERPVALRYLLALPDGYADPDSADASWPLVLFLHGAGERGDSLARVAIHGPARLAREGQRFPFVLVSPRRRRARGGTPANSARSSTTSRRGTASTRTGST